jgi:aspartyl-tRNA(Asn)/glutamyl-tRNA(Gln) amidotransferase subunit B
MEKGAMRCEANISLRAVGSQPLGTKVEVKNLNSFRSVKLALEYEIQRQAHMLDTGQPIHQVTMGWDEHHGRTVEQRAKEESDDYRYFPEPDLPPLHIAPSWVQEIQIALPELPDHKRDRFISDYGLAPKDAETVVADREVADYFEAAVTSGMRQGIAPKSVSNWLTGEVFRLLKAHELTIRELSIPPEGLLELIALVEKGTITAASGKAVLTEMFETGRSVSEIVNEKGLAQVSDQEALRLIVDQVLTAHPEEVARYHEGKGTLLQWFLGQVMKATRGKANPQMALTLLERALNDNPEAHP